MSESTKAAIESLRNHTGRLAGRVDCSCGRPDHGYLVDIHNVSLTSMLASDALCGEMESLARRVDALEGKATAENIAEDNQRMATADVVQVEHRDDEIRRLTAQRDAAIKPAIGGRMVLCSICGDKRCPKATYHGNDCINFPAPGQVSASVLTPVPAIEPVVEVEHCPASVVFGPDTESANEEGAYPHWMYFSDGYAGAVTDKGEYYAGSEHPRDIVGPAAEGGR